MEENIKIINEMLIQYKNAIKSAGETKNIKDIPFADVWQKQVDAIENLIKGYKELEEVCNAQANKINNYEEWIKVGMIPKSKVREKIKEYNEIIYYAQTEEGMAELKDFEYEEAKYGIQILEELLEEGDDK